MGRQLAIKTNAPVSAERMVEVQTGDHAKNTNAQYTSALRKFDKWIDDNELVVCDATLVNFLIMLADAGYKHNSLGVYRAAVLSKYGKTIDPASGKFIDALDPAISAKTLSNIRRERASGTRAEASLNIPQPQKAISIDLLKRLAALKSAEDWADGEWVRNKAIMLLSWWGGFRCSELCALVVDDVEFVDGGVVIRIEKSKTDQMGAGKTKPIAELKGSNLDPVAALKEWVDGYRANARGDAPLFYGFGLDRQPVPERHLWVRSVTMMLRRELERAGENPDGYSSHSFRSGFITWSRENGVPDNYIMSISGHSSAASLNIYHRVDSKGVMERVRTAAKMTGV